MWGHCAGRGGAGDQRGRCAYSGFRLQAVSSRAGAGGCPGSCCTERLPIQWRAEPNAPFEILLSSPITPSSAPAR